MPSSDVQKSEFQIWGVHFCRVFQPHSAFPCFNPAKFDQRNQRENKINPPSQSNTQTQNICLWSAGSDRLRNPRGRGVESDPGRRRGQELQQWPDFSPSLLQLRPEGGEQRRMTELLNGRPTPSTQCFNALPKPPSLLFLSISSRALINEAVGLGRTSLKPQRCGGVKTERKTIKKRRSV